MLIAIRSDIKSDRYTNVYMTRLEAICIMLHTESGTIYIYCMYIQPSASLDIYRDHLKALEELMKHITPIDTVLIFGDLNFGKEAKWIENEDGFDFTPVIGESQSVKATIAREATTRILEAGLFQISN